jgi:anaerobic selenocysteine-containing dehydrogenase
LPGVHGGDRLLLNETTRHADVVLPGTFALQHDHYDLLLNTSAVRNVARYSAPVLPPPASGREDWQILLELATGITRRAGGLRTRLHGMEAAFLRRFTLNGVPVTAEAAQPAPAPSRTG